MLKARLMVVEDEGLVALQIKEGLENLGYDVPVVTSSGEEALKSLAQNEIDLVIMDIRLKGGMSGIEAARHIIGRLDIPIVYLTAYSDEDTINQARDTEPFGYVLKPFDERSLHAAVQMALRKSKNQQKLRGSRDWLSSIIRSMAEALIISDIKGQVKYLNPAAETLTGWTQEEAFGKRLQDVFRALDEKTRTAVEIPISQPILEGKTALRENQILVAKDGTEAAIDYSLASLRRETGTVFGVILVFRDIKDRKKSQEMIERELGATVEIQEKSLPPKGVSFHGIKTDWLFHPSVFGAGDRFNVFMLDDSHMGFYLLDVMGHGFTAALFSMMLHRFLSPSPERGGILLRPDLEGSARIVPPVEVLKELNRRFHFTRDDSPFFTTVYGIIEVKSGEITMVRAGHPYPIHQKRSGEAFPIESEGSAIGLFPEIEAREKVFRLEKGDRLFLYSDGLTECADHQMNRFSTFRLIRLLVESRSDALSVVLERIGREIVGWRGVNRFTDDVSLLAMERE